MKRLALAWLLSLLPAAAFSQTQYMTFPATTEPAAPSEWLVGREVITSLPQTDDAAESAPSPDSPSWFATTRPSTVQRLAVLGKVFDYMVIGPEGMSTSSLHVMVPWKRVQPFASIAMESNDAEDRNTLGFGAGTRINITRRANFGTEMLVFPSDRDLSRSSTMNLGDVRVLTRLEIRF